MEQPKSIDIYENKIESYRGYDVDVDVISFETEDYEKNTKQERVVEIMKTFINRDKIKRLCITVSSCLVDLSFLHLFPNLETLRIDSPEITNLTGIVKLPHLKGFSVDRNMKIKRSIAGIEKLELKSLYVYLKNREDLE